MYAYLGSNLLEYPIVNFKLFFFANCSASSASFMVGASGFSTNTCFPFSRHSITKGNRSVSGVIDITIASTLLSSTRSFQLSVIMSGSSSALSSCCLFSSISAIYNLSTIGFFFTAVARIPPTHPTPTTPTFI